MSLLDPADLLAAVHGPWAYLALGAAALAESAAFIGLLVPGETVMLLAGTLAATGQLTLGLAVLTAVAGAVLGDQIGYSLGRAVGPALRASRLGRRIGPGRWARAEALVGSRGGPAVLLGRWVGLLRAVVPAVAGMVGMPRSVFSLWNMIGGTLWASTVVGIGYLVGSSWNAAQGWLGSGATVVAAAFAVLVCAAVLWRRRRTATP